LSNIHDGTVCRIVDGCAGRALAFVAAMIINEEMLDAFTEVLNAAGADVCASCGRRALVKIDCDTPPERASVAGADSAAVHAADATWFCFACGKDTKDTKDT